MWKSIQISLLVFGALLSGCTKPSSPKNKEKSSQSPSENPERPDRRSQQSAASAAEINFKNADDAVQQITKQMNTISLALESRKSKSEVNLMVDALAELNERFAKDFSEPERLMALGRSEHHAAALTRYQKVVVQLDTD